MKMRKFLAVGTLLILITSIFAGCSARAPGAAYDKSENYYAEMETIPATTGAALESTNTTTTSAAPINQKLIRTVRLEAETEAMDDLLASVV